MIIVISLVREGVFCWSRKIKRRERGEIQFVLRLSFNLKKKKKVSCCRSRNTPIRLFCRRDFYHSTKNQYHHPHHYHAYDYRHDRRSHGRKEEVGRDRYTIKHKENRKKEEADVVQGQYKKKSPDSVLSEISGGSGSDRSVLSATEDNEAAAPSPSRKKRKLSPIQINAKSKNAFVSNILSDPLFIQSSKGASAYEHKPSPAKDLSGSLGSSAVSPPVFWQGRVNRVPGKIEGDNGCFLSNKKIPASRWADEEEGEISEEEGINDRETSMPSSASSECHADLCSNDDVVDDENDEGPTYGYDSDLEEENDHVAALCQQRTINMLHSCRSVGEYEKLNKIGAGTYGVVHRARDKKTGEFVALKKVKMEKEREGFPITALREIDILLSAHHPSIVDVKEVVVKEDAVEGKNKTYLVMEYMEHDLKHVIKNMKYPFSQSDVKCLMLQLLEGVKYLHDNWVLHRDLKTSNILLNNCGQLKICDFGMSRQYGSPLKPYTPLVVSLWYRAPELLLGVEQYSTAVDMWSVGCIMAELLAKKPLFQGESELDQLKKIFEILGTPDETTWPGFSELPGFKLNFGRKKRSSLREKFPPKSFTGSPYLSSAGYDLLSRLLAHDPKRRISAEEAVNHEWFREIPLPKEKEFMPTFPVEHAKAGY